ncbi:FIG00018398: hypothetical regulator [hydrothermal vent metagenome]|uniref:FIG00018398: hypothetical regulator n=1 Tax=hydrothermal vent metagenome TaxID=652676 RepID=A0A3B0UJM9_9ZZZZ
MYKFFIITGSLSGMLSVMIGAFGAHALKSTLEATNRLTTFETAVKYQFYHSLALILLGLLMIQFQHKAFTISGYGFIIGILIFSGSLYALSLTGYTKLGAITPLGGLAFIIGWAAFAWGSMKSLH